MIQTTSTRNTQQTARPTQSEQHTTVDTITCAICDAVYTSTPVNQSASQAPSTTLESTFMSMCHFCFRCRRPACPACWDAIHGICGDCVQELKLPFRTEMTPLEGVIFPPKLPVRTDQATYTPSPLICLRSGHFSVDEPLLITSHNAISLPSSPSSEHVTLPGQKQQNNHIQITDDADSPEPFLLPSALDIEDIEEPAEPRVGFLKIMERIITFILLLILLTIIALIILAELSPDANAQFIHLLHIDIRSEIAYLISLIRQLHW